MVDGRAKGAPQELRLIELHREDEHAIGAYGNIVVVASVAPPDMAFMALSHAVTRKGAAPYPQGVGMLVVIDGRAGPPSDEVRAAIRAYYLDLKETVRAAVHVVEGEGFAAAAKRGALTLLNMTARAPFPTRIAGTVDEGIAQMRKSLGPLWLPEVEPSALAKAIATLRAPLVVRPVSAPRRG